MKKIKRLFSLLLCCMLCLFTAACNSNQKGDVTDSSESSYIKLESFDSYKTVNKIYCDKSIGDGSVSKEYFSEGEGSFRVQVAPDSDENRDQLRSTFFYVPMQRENASYIDFSMIDQVALDVYGVEGTNLAVSIALVLKGKTVIAGPAQTFEVKSGEWSSIYFDVNRTVTNSTFDIKKVSHVRITCMGVNAVICVDNMLLHRAATEFIEAEAALDKDEFCDFEKAYQSFMVVARDSNGITPGVEVVTDPERATSGAHSLKVDSPEYLAGTYYWLTFSTKLCAASEFTKYPDTSYFVLDVYKPFEVQWSLSVRFVNDSNSYISNKARIPEGIGWHTICVPMKNRVTKTTFVQLTWHSTSGLDKDAKSGFSFYVDNMRYMSELPTQGSIYVVPEVE